MRRGNYILPFLLAFSLLGALVSLAEAIRAGVPVVDIATDAPSVLGTPTSFTATVVGVSGVDFVWDLGDGAIATGPAISHSYQAFGSYTVLVTGTQGGATYTGTIRVDIDIPVAAPWLSESFETNFPPDDWLVQQMATGTDPWLRSDGSPSKAYSGNFSAYHDDTAGAQQDAWLVTPLVTPTASSQLLFWQQVNYQPFYEPGGHTVWVSSQYQDPKDGPVGGHYQLLAELAPGINNEDQWQQAQLSLAGYAGTPIYIAFRYRGQDDTEWFLDDIGVTTELLASHDGPKAPGEAVTLMAQAPTGSRVQYVWDLGSGDIRHGAFITTSFSQIGDYTAVVTATNSVSSVTQTLTIPIREMVFLPLLVRN
jgi:hypothetical protein